MIIWCIDGNESFPTIFCSQIYYNCSCIMLEKHCISNNVQPSSNTSRILQARCTNIEYVYDTWIPGYLMHTCQILLWQFLQNNLPHMYQRLFTHDWYKWYGHNSKT